jgi:predicted phage baseplate assembly protein
MPLSNPNLDDLRFQRDLVDEARKRIIHYCPEWTEYNLSDPGITLIELFAWMTEMLAYRLNRVPEKNYIKFLELLGLHFQPASSARADLTFWLSTSLPIGEDLDQTVVVPQGLQASTASGSSDSEVFFTTDLAKTIYAPHLMQLRKANEAHKNYAARMGLEIFLPFHDQPQLGDTFWIGFTPEKDISGHILQLNFTCQPTEAVGIRRQDPPLVWECSLGGGRWQELPLSTLSGERDTTGGLNNPEGSLVLYLPLAMALDNVNGQSAYWLRCRYEQRNEMQGVYTASPRIISIRPATLGVSVPATHAQVVEKEMLAHSNGDPGQTFQLQFFPVLNLQEGETLEIEERRNGEAVFVPWTCVESFAQSTLHDRHFKLDAAHGLVELGPAVRQPDGTVRQYGRIPENGRAVRFSRYRYGSGANGNVPENALQTMTSSFAYLARVTNLQRAVGGRDQETLEELKMRAQRELQAQKRTVTAGDYETLLKNYSRAIARVKCVSPQEETSLKPGVVELLVVPEVGSALLAGDLGSLKLSTSFLREARAFLDDYRLLTTSVQIREPHYTGVKVRAEIVVDDFHNPDQVCARVERALSQYLSPLAFESEEKIVPQLQQPGWEGWEFGRGLFSAEISSLIQRVPGVKYVVDMQISTRSVDPEREQQRVPEIDAEDAAQPLKERMLWIPKNGLVCSLAHEVRVADLEKILHQGRMS